MANANIAARLAEVAARQPSRAALVEYRGGRARRLTYGEFAVRVAAVAAAMRRQGIGPGDRVLIFVPMSIDLYVVLLGCLHAGAVAVFVDAWAGVRRLDAAVALARPKLFVATPRAHLLRLASRTVRGIARHWLIGRRWWSLDRLVRDAAPAAAPAALAPEAPALVTFTTGSTGAPKAAQRTHGFLWAQHTELAAHLGTRRDDVDMPTLPVFVLNNLAVGATSVIPDFDPRRPAEIDPRAIHHQLVTERVDTVSGSPAFFERLGGWCAERNTRIPVRALFTGGAPVYPRLARLLAERCAGTAHVVYGSTEAEPVAGIEATAMLDAMADAPPGAPGGLCVGRPVPGIAVRIVRALDAPIALDDARGWTAWQLAAGEAGEIVVAGAHVLGGYLGDPEADGLQKIRDGATLWHRTGDGGWIDAHGRLWLLGRVGSRIVRDGETWWSVPAELAALEVDGVEHAACFGVPDAPRGMRTVLCLQTADGALGARHRRQLEQRLGALPVDELHVLRHIPRDPRHASKTDLARLRAAIRSG